MQSCQGCSSESEHFLQELACGHRHCENCVSTNKKSTSVTCAFKPKRGGDSFGCGKTTDINDIQRRPSKKIKYKVPEGAEGGAAAQDPGTMTELTSDGDMEDDFKELAKLFPEKEETNKENDVWDWMNELSKKAIECESILAFEEDEKGEKIVVDILPGKKGDVKNFLNVGIFTKPFDENKFIFVEQQNLIVQWAVEIGAKTAPLPPYEALINQPPDQLHDRNRVSSVTFLGKDRIGQRYLITSGHLYTNDKQHGGYISVYGDRLRHVADDCRSFVGNINITDHGNVVVDIAAMRLSDGFQIQETLIRALNPIHTYRELPRNHDVYKRGAFSGTTCGRIERDRRWIALPNIQPRVGGFVFSVKSTDPHQNLFSVRGDSGGLIWSARQPIGMVCCHEYGRQQHPLTYGVRLDHCITALRENRGIDIVEMLAVGPEWPVHIPAPIGMLRGLDLDAEPLQA